MPRPNLFWSSIVQFRSLFHFQRNMAQLFARVSECHNPCSIPAPDDVTAGLYGDFNATSPFIFHFRFYFFFCIFKHSLTIKSGASLLRVTLSLDVTFPGHTSWEKIKVIKTSSSLSQHCFANNDYQYLARRISISSSLPL